MVHIPLLSISGFFFIINCYIITVTDEVGTLVLSLDDSTTQDVSRFINPERWNPGQKNL